MAKENKGNPRPNKKNGLYIVRLFLDARDDLSLGDSVIDLLAVLIMTAFLLAFKVAGAGESRELYYSAVLYFFLSLILVLVFKVFILAPYRIIKEQDEKLEGNAMREQKARILHDGIIKLQNRMRYLNGSKRYFEITGEEERGSIEIVDEIYNLLFSEMGADVAAHYAASRSTTKPLVRFGAISEHDYEWTRHLDFIDAHIESLKTIIEKQM